LERQHLSRVLFTGGVNRYEHLVTFSFVQQVSNISGSYTCSFGNVGCLGDDNSGRVVSGKIEGVDLSESRSPTQVTAFIKVSSLQAKELELICVLPVLVESSRRAVGTSNEQVCDYRSLADFLRVKGVHYEDSQGEVRPRIISQASKLLASGDLMESGGIADMMRDLVEMAVLGMEDLAVTVILIAILFGTGRYIFHFIKRMPESYEQYKVQLGKALLLGLQLLVAADVIRTVALELTLESVTVLRCSC
jgi:uncharacterized membrane protein